MFVKHPKFPRSQYNFKHLYFDRIIFRAGSVLSFVVPQPEACAAGLSWTLFLVLTHRSFSLLRTQGAVGRPAALGVPAPCHVRNPASLDLFALGGNEIFCIHFTCPKICVLKNNLSLKHKQIPKFVCPPTQGEIGIF